ncbi:MAG: hypothetical protein AB7O96_14275 [Pseudobdellovibrionaceae bacterium]
MKPDIKEETMERPTCASHNASTSSHFEAETKVNLIVDYIVKPGGGLAFCHPFTKKPCPCVLEGSLQEAIRAHVTGDDKLDVSVRDNRRKIYRGPLRLGAYLPLRNGFTHFAVIDIDGGAKHASSLKDPFQAAVKVHAKALSMGIPSHIEVSGSGEGAHLWFFFEKPIEAWKARQLLFHLCDGEQFPLLNGGSARPHSNEGIEVFPKQDRIEPGGYGNLVWLPFWHGAKPGCCEFVQAVAA